MRSFVLVLLAAGTTLAAPRRVILVGYDPVLQHAVEVALGPWNLEVRTSPGTISALPAAARLAQVEQAAAIVWTSSDGYLWIYDAESAQAITRQVEMTSPLDASTAAALALSVKTLLRSTTVAPPAERLGAVNRPREELRLEARLGALALFGNPKDAELRVGLGLAWYPRRLDRWLGLALRVETGLRTSVNRNGFNGNLIDVTVAFEPRLHLALGKRAELEPGLGVGLHVTSLDGGVLLALPAHEVRANWSLEGGLALDVHLGKSVRLGLIATVAYLFEYQTYKVNGTPVLELFPVELDTALRLAVGVL